MARLLVATVPLTGHVEPMLLLVRTLVERGHAVSWYAGQKFAAAIERTGATHVPMRAAPDWDDADIEVALPELRGKRGLGRVKAQLRAMFISPAPAQLRDLEAAVEELAPDAVIADQAHLGAALLHEKRGLPWAGVGISALVIPSIDTAPFGSALPPARDQRDHPRNRLLNWLILRVLFGGVNRSFRRMRAAAGLPAGTATYFDVLSPQLFLQPTVPAFEYPRSDLPPQVHFIGPLVGRAAPDTELPAWWQDVVAAHREGMPIVLVTQGTLATDARQLIGPTLRALAGEDVLVIATTGRTLDVPLADAVPNNARVATFVPYQVLMPMVSVMVTNGGYGGVQIALHHGVPLVVAGGSEEKPEIAARVAWSGAGIDLRTGTPSARAIRSAVRRVRTTPGFRERARALAEDMAGQDAPVRGAELIEQLASTRSAVLRAAPAPRLLSAG